MKFTGLNILLFIGGLALAAIGVARIAFSGDKGTPRDADHMEKMRAAKELKDKADESNTQT